MMLDVNRFLTGWNIEITSYYVPRKVAHLRVDEGWSQNQIDQVADMLNEVYERGYVDGRDVG